MKWLLELALIVGMTMPVYAQDAPTATVDECNNPSGVKLRIRWPGIAAKDLTLAWSGNIDCTLNGDELDKITRQDFIQFEIPGVEVDDTGIIQGSLRAYVTNKPEVAQNIDITIPNSEPKNFSPKIFFYFESFPNNEDSLIKLNELLNEEKIYQVFFGSKGLVDNPANYNIGLVSTYLYYQSATLIEQSTGFSRGRLIIADDAKKEMKAKIEAIMNQDDIDHLNYENALNNYRRLIRSIDKIKSELDVTS
jgi:hypothetical protein